MTDGHDELNLLELRQRLAAHASVLETRVGLRVDSRRFEVGHFRILTDPSNVLIDFVPVSVKIVVAGSKRPPTSLSVRCGLRATSPIGVQLRVAQLQRSGFGARAR